VAGGSIVLRDVPPYVMGGGSTSAEPHGINSEGLKRRGFSPASIESIRRAYKTLYRSGLGFEEAKQSIADQAREVPELQVLVEFLASSTRGVIR
jgi:UDP-N-acetylglucosamine acyltransferase